MRGKVKPESKTGAKIENQNPLVRASFSAECAQTRRDFTVAIAMDRINEMRELNKRQRAFAQSEVQRTVDHFLGISLSQIHEVNGIAAVREQLKNFNLRLRLEDPSEPKHPAVNLVEVTRKRITLITIERLPREITFQYWPKLQVFEATTGRGSNVTSDQAAKLAIARMTQIPPKKRKEIAQHAAEARHAKKS
jgi:hypothetical protein